MPLLHPKAGHDGNADKGQSDNVQHELSYLRHARQKTSSSLAPFGAKASPFGDVQLSGFLRKLLKKSTLNSPNSLHYRGAILNFKSLRFGIAADRG
jgi:hypothetical protein